MTLFVTSPLPVIDLPADSRHQSGHGLKPQVIILHATGGTDSRKWLSTDPSSNVSIHRLIMKSGDLYKIVPDESIAHHVGYSRLGTRSNLNSIALGIEFENLNSGTDPYPAAQLRMGVLQIIEWWGKFGLLPILTHAQVDTTGKTDPAGFPWSQFHAMVRDEIKKILGAGAGINPTDLAALRTAADAARAAALKVQEEVGVVQAWINLAAVKP